MRYLVTGGAGCIGSELVGRLLDEGHHVVVYDNFSTGKEEHVEAFLSNPRMEVVRADILDLGTLAKNVKGADAVFHLAAYSTVKYEEGQPTYDSVSENVIGTYNVLEAMRLNGVKKILFSSTSAVYGDTPVPTKENAPLTPISLYGASKAACENLIHGFCNMFDIQSWVFRFANVYGGKSRKSGTMVITDFITKLRKDTSSLEILGNGLQEKSYMTVGDCIDAMLFCIKQANERVNIFNLGTGDTITVNEVAEIVADEMKIKNVKFRYTGGDRGWVGDMPKALLDITKLESLGWKAKHTSRESVVLAVREMLKNS